MTASGTPDAGPGEVCILSPIWGAGYIAQFLDFCLPSLLARGNIPAIAHRHGCTLHLLTRAEDAAQVRLHPSWARLAAICRTAIDPIDDLVSLSPATTLTLAYARGMRARGTMLRGTIFIFLVGDYVLAEGALDSAVRAIEGGASGVLTGNVMATREGIAASLERFRDPLSGALGLQAGELMALALAHAHPATRAATVAELRTEDRDGAGIVSASVPFHDPDANRFFWRVGDAALLGRFFLAHMIAIRPEVDDFTIDAPSDYAFVPELCPSGEVVHLTDSDRFCVIEMQPAASSRPGILFGPHRPDQVAASLGRWTTQHHRDTAGQTWLFHGGPVDPALLDRARQEADRFIAAVAARLAAPYPVRRHPLWPRMLDHHAATAATSPDPAVLRHLLGPDSRLPGSGSSSSGMRQALLGRLPRLRSWHPRWVDWRLLRAGIAERCAGRRVLLAPTSRHALNEALRAQLLAAGAMEVALFPAERGDYDLALMLWRDSGFASLDEGVCRLAADLGGRGEIVLFLCDLGDEAGGTCDAADLAALSGVVDFRGIRSTAWRRAVQGTLMSEARSAARHSRARLLARLPVLAVLAALSLAQNLAARSGARAVDARACSSLLLTLRPARARP